jgi:hypothetical protein
MKLKVEVPYEMMVNRHHIRGVTSQKTLKYSSFLNMFTQHRNNKVPFSTTCVNCSFTQYGCRDRLPPKLITMMMMMMMMMMKKKIILIRIIQNNPQ